MVSPANSVIDLDFISINSSTWDGPLCPCYSLWDTDHTLTEAQRNFLGSMMIIGCGGILFSLTWIAGVPARSSPSEYPTLYAMTGGGILLSVAELCCVKPLQYIFRRWNHNQYTTILTESSPLLSEVRSEP